MDNSGDAQNPMFLVALLHQTFPQFAERDPKGALKQQDANEAWLSLAQYLNMMKVRQKNSIYNSLKWVASSGWSFGPSSAWDSKESMTIRKTHPTLYEIFRAKRIAQV